mmetsp:Transcript_6743/g.27535  ORF Transcript_6743/g.27535 Transcript_6743/m.27535 type:complete len:365 (+) Transcript_6743:1605-2699(+)
MSMSDIPREGFGPHSPPLLSESSLSSAPPSAAKVCHPASFSSASLSARCGGSSSPSRSRIVVAVINTKPTLHSLHPGFSSTAAPAALATLVWRLPSSAGSTAGVTPAAAAADAHPPARSGSHSASVGDCNAVHTTLVATHSSGEPCTCVKSIAATAGTRASSPGTTSVAATAASTPAMPISSKDAMISTIATLCAPAAGMSIFRCVLTGSGASANARANVGSASTAFLMNTGSSSIVASTPGGASSVPTKPLISYDNAQALAPMDDGLRGSSPESARRIAATRGATRSRSSSSSLSTSAAVRSPPSPSSLLPYPMRSKTSGVFTGADCGFSSTSASPSTSARVMPARFSPTARSSSTSSVASSS